MSIELLGLTERGNFEGSNVLSIPDQEDRMRWRDRHFSACANASTTRGRSAFGPVATIRS